MAYQSIFKRYEIKYMLNSQQRKAIETAISAYMILDQYGRTEIRNIYYDTKDYRIIRHCLEKPLYKEKLRLRSYGAAGADAPVFVELKKKYNSVVYKRRLSMPEQQALNWLQGSALPPPGQIAAEIAYFLSFYSTLHPALYLSYQREAWYCKDGSDLRITFDDTILCDPQCPSLERASGGIPLLQEGRSLMEIKTSGGIPLWLTTLLTQEGIFKTSYSKYGTAYQTVIFPQLKGDHLHA